MPVGPIVPRSSSIEVTPPVDPQIHSHKLASVRQSAVTRAKINASDRNLLYHSPLARKLTRREQRIECLS